MPEFDCGYKNDASATIMATADLEGNIQVRLFAKKKKKNVQHYNF